MRTFKNILETMKIFFLFAFILISVNWSITGWADVSAEKKQKTKICVQGLNAMQNLALQQPEIFDARVVRVVRYVQANLLMADNYTYLKDKKEIEDFRAIVDSEAIGLITDIDMCEGLTLAKYALNIMASFAAEKNPKDLYKKYLQCAKGLKALSLLIDIKDEIQRESGGQDKALTKNSKAIEEYGEILSTAFVTLNFKTLFAIDLTAAEKELDAQYDAQKATELYLEKKIDILRQQFTQEMRDFLFNATKIENIIELKNLAQNNCLICAKLGYGQFVDILISEKKDNKKP